MVAGGAVWIQWKNSICDLNCTEIQDFQNWFKTLSRQTPQSYRFYLVSSFSSFLYFKATLKWEGEVFRNMLGTCLQVLLTRMSVYYFFFLSSRPTALKKYNIFQQFIYLKYMIPSVPSRSLLFQVLFIFILVACCLLISGPACSCCSLPCRWNTQVSPFRSQEYSWSVDWQSRRTTCKETGNPQIKEEE